MPVVRRACRRSGPKGRLGPKSDGARHTRVALPYSRAAACPPCRCRARGRAEGDRIVCIAVRMLAILLLQRSNPGRGVNGPNREAAMKRLLIIATSAVLLAACGVRDTGP